MGRIASRMDGHQIDADSTDGRGQRRIGRRRIGRQAKGVGAVGGEFHQPPGGKHPPAEGQPYAPAVQHRADRRRHVRGTVGLGMIVGELRAGQHHGRAGMLQGQQQRRFLHRVGAVQNDDARRPAARFGAQFGAHGIADPLHVGQGQGRGILGEQIDGPQPDRRQIAQPVQQRLPVQAGRAGPVRVLAAGDGAAGGDDGDKGRGDHAAALGSSRAATR
ncbi:hypothetical protein PARHAE_01733 [Paracoccus haematequi]|uniref:Uncharacterized protein n=1 Tax=Paracoccus haematequi TaxID=2491866 RepID=A0A3S4CJE4_9RHOB|nr:hypothetical protein PARHAE_01733 [Paracoccus haematequi]